ncbi:MAG: hypothetical protein OK422_05775 [Thaumarchaeota archaeon]|nr:hypothetical protein [Nitrososphaerota archaeon]
MTNGGKDEEEILRRVRSLEAGYDWFGASTLLDSLAKQSTPSNSQLALRAIFEAGHCLSRGAYQASSTSSFRKNLRRASEEYLKAEKAWRKSKDRASVANAARARAAALFSDSHLALRPTETKKLLESSANSFREAAQILGRSEDHLSFIQAANDFLDCLASLSDMEWDPNKRREVVEEALDVGRKAISKNSKSKGAQSARLHFLLAKHALFASFLLKEQEDRKRAREDARRLVSKSVDLANEAGDDLLVSRASLLFLATTGYTNRTPVVFRKNLRIAMDHAQRCRDTEAIAEALFAKAFDLVWEMASEEDPTKKHRKFAECEALSREAITRFQTVMRNDGVSFTYALGMSQAYYRLAFTEPNLNRKRSLLQEAVSLARKALPEYERSGVLGDDSPARTLMALLSSLSTLTSEPEEKRTLLNEAAELAGPVDRHTMASVPFHEWDRGIVRFGSARIQSELAELTQDRDQKVDLLNSAVTDAEEAIRLCKKHFAPSGVPHHLTVAFANYESLLAAMYHRLDLLTSDERLKERERRLLAQAGADFKEAGWPSRSAEMHWQIAERLSQSGEHSKSAEEFLRAAESYELAASKMRRFGKFFNNYAAYMTAWSEIENARKASESGDYPRSSDHYLRTSTILARTQDWANLSDYFAAWSLFQRGEALGDKGAFIEATGVFSEAGKAFFESQQKLERRASATVDTRELGELTTFANSAKERVRYSEGRAALESARSFDSQNEKSESSKEYGRAASIFEALNETVPPGQEHNELFALAGLSRGWEAMKNADDHLRPDLYEKAATLFGVVVQSSAGRNLPRLAAGDASLCRAMSSGLKFRETGDLQFYSQAKTLLASAKEYYETGKFQRNADWAEITMQLLDAYVFSLEAETTPDASRKQKSFLSAEKCLESAATLCEAAGYHARKADVDHDLERVRKKLQLASTLAQLLVTPPFPVSATSFQMPASETASGLSAFEGVNVQSQFKCRESAEVGDVLEIQLQLFNSGRKAATLLKIENLIPAELQPIEIPSQYSVSGTALNLRGKRLDPMKIESFGISFRAVEPIEVTIRPTVSYLDESGNPESHFCESRSIRISPQQTFEFKNAGAKSAFEFLVEAFVSDYMKKKLSAEQAGWTSLIELARESKVSVSSVYGRGGKYGPVLYELLSRGLVESRFFSGQRGRGGKVVKVRLNYDREPIKRYIERKVMIIK